MSSSVLGKRIIYFVTEDWYFCSHRLHLAVAAKDRGYDVYVVTREQSHGDRIREAGLKLVPVELSRRSKNPFVELRLIWRLTRIYREIRPDIVHHVAVKPVIYGTIAARVARVPKIVNAMAGLGFLFSSRDALARLLRPIVRLSFRLLVNNDRVTVILQNPDDIQVLCHRRTVDYKRVRLILGSGVNTAVYRFVPPISGVPLVLMASRLLWDKGVGEFVDAANQIKRDGIEARFVLAGDRDEENPNSVSVEDVDQWRAEANVEFWGRRSDMPDVFSQVHIVCLPTAYGEGVPKVLIEAASCGRPIVATNAPGCREIVRDGENGILVPVKDVDALIAALRKLIESPELRVKMGLAGRALVKEKFSLADVIEQTLSVYQRDDE